MPAARNSILTTLGALLAASTAATSSASAQKTWVVDANRGPGHDYAAIAPAITAASDGDAIVVRPGSYAFPSTVSKAVRLLGEQGAILDLGPLASPFTISQIGAGKTFVLAGFRIQANYAQAGYFRVTDCQGSVSFEDLVCFAILFNIQSVQVERCRVALFSRCDISGGLIARDSNIALDACTLSPFGAGATVALERSKATLTACKASGIDGFLRPAGPALSSMASSVRLVAGVGSTFSAGTNGKVSAVIGDAQSSLTLDPLVRLQPSGGAKDHDGFGSARTGPMPALGVAGSAIGGLHRFTLHAQTNDVFALFFGLPNHVNAAPFGDLWLDLPTLFHVTSGVVPGGLAIFTVPATKDVTLRGLPATWQALILHGTSLELTNPVITTMR